MVAKSIVILAVVCCTIAISAAAAIYDNEVLLVLSGTPNELSLVPLSRHARSPDGSVSIDYSKDAGGRRAGAEYQQNLYKGDKGRFNVDAYGRAERDFDRNRNNFGGGVRGSWRF